MTECCGVSSKCYCYCCFNIGRDCGYVPQLFVMGRWQNDTPNKDGFGILYCISKVAFHQNSISHILDTLNISYYFKPFPIYTDLCLEIYVNLMNWQHQYNIIYVNLRTNHSYMDGHIQCEMRTHISTRSTRIPHALVASSNDDYVVKMKTKKKKIQNSRQPQINDRKQVQVIFQFTYIYIMWLHIIYNIIYKTYKYINTRALF